MKLEDQVASLELSKRLKELGVKQESLFYWDYADAPLKDGNRWYIRSKKDISESDWEMWGTDIISAFTVAELGDTLLDVYCYRTPSDEDPNEWACIKYSDGEHSRYEWVVHAPTEADARAKMIIYLIENKLIDLSAKLQKE